MVTDWYQSLTFRKCPRAFKIGYLDGAQLREMPVAQSTARFVRDGIRHLISGTNPDVAAAVSQGEYMDQVRQRGLSIDHAKNNSYYRASVEETATINRLVTNYSKDFYGFAVEASDLNLEFTLAPGVQFVSHPVAVLEREGQLWLLHVKVTGSWDKERSERLHRDFELLGELAALRKHIEPNPEARPIGGTVVQVLVTGKKSMQHPAIYVPYDEELVQDWITQVASEQEQLVSKIHIATELAPAMGSAELLRFAINQVFPQYQHSCDYPYPCEFRLACWGDLRNHNPLDDPRYMQRDLLVKIKSQGQCDDRPNP